jgi:hypothetical protein
VKLSVAVKKAKHEYASYNGASVQFFVTCIKLIYHTLKEATSTPPRPTLKNCQTPQIKKKLFIMRFTFYLFMPISFHPTLTPKQNKKKIKNQVGDMMVDEILLHTL